MGKTAQGLDTGAVTRTIRDAGVIARTIESIDHRAMAADGPVTPTLEEATVAELRRIYQACKRIQKRWAR
jgi:carbamoylphosphate synthase small subunit